MCFTVWSAVFRLQVILNKSLIDHNYNDLEDSTRSKVPHICSTTTLSPKVQSVLLNSDPFSMYTSTETSSPNDLEHHKVKVFYIFCQYHWVPVNCNLLHSFSQPLLSYQPFWGKCIDRMTLEKHYGIKSRGSHDPINYGLIRVLVFDREERIPDHYLRPLSETYIDT